MSVLKIPRMRVGRWHERASVETGRRKTGCETITRQPGTLTAMTQAAPRPSTASV